MSDPSILTNLPLEQQAIRAKCFHPRGTFVEFDKEEIEQSISDRFEQIVAKYPDRIALKTKNHSVTYDALNQAANRLARAMLAKCGEHEEPVVLLLEHDAPMIVGILATFKTGKPCVPLDPGYHEARANYILQDSQAKLLVTNSKNLSSTYSLTQNVGRVINIDDLDVSFSSERLGLSVSPDAYSYILYTSGSTGQPKGVVQKHRNLLFDVRNYTNSFHICADDRLTLFASCSSGEGMKNLLSGLLNGATVHPWDFKQDGFANLASWLIKEEISIYISTPAVFRNFMSTLNGETNFPKLRLVRLGSGSVHKKDVELYKKQLHPECILMNWLSSTEAGNFAHFFIDKTTGIAGDIVPVGYAVEEKQVLLLDDGGQQVGNNQIGEITVRSRYLSPCYWRRPDLTQAKFLPDPDGADKRIYRTGDLGRSRSDGCLQYVGRKDLQVKVRGYRIETPEIETALLALKRIKEAVVTPRDDGSGDKRLVAYIVAAGQPAPTVSDLRSFLSERLPDYMVPSAFIFLKSLPLTPNGKLDRLALPDPGKSRPDLDTPFVAPRTAVEEELAQGWSEVLSIAQVGIHDNFFDLGGHSLAATRIVSQVIKKFQLELPLKTLFDSPTVAEMAAVIMQNQANQATDQDLERLLSEVEAMPEAEAGRKLASTRASRENPDAER